MRAIFYEDPNYEDHVLVVGNETIEVPREKSAVVLAMIPHGVMWLSDDTCPCLFGCEHWRKEFEISIEQLAVIKNSLVA